MINGDLCEIIDDGKIYTTVDDIADKMGLNKYENGFSYENGRIKLTGEICTVINCDCIDDCIGIYVHKYDRDVVIDIGAVEILTQKIVPDELFEI